MRIGISIQSAYRVSDPREGARFMVERAEAARQADLDSLFVGDHHVTDHPYYQNSPILGRMLAHWHDKPAGALYLLPLWHPVLLADSLTRPQATHNSERVLEHSHALAHINTHARTLVGQPT